MLKNFIPVERSTEGLPMREPNHPSGLKWYVLIKRMEELRKRTGMGLARTWGYVHEGDYEAALASFEGALEIRTH